MATPKRSGRKWVGVPAGVEQRRAGEGERKRLRPRPAAVEPHGAGAEQEQVAEEAHGPVLAGREQHRREVAADPRESGEQARVEPLGEERPRSPSRRT